MADEQPATPAEEKDIDIAAGVESIATDLGLGLEGKEPETPPEEETPETPETPAAPEQPVVRAAPKSWAKEQHEHWAKVPKEAQDYIELREKQMLDGLEQYKGDAGFGKSMREVTTPYKSLLTAQGVDEAKAVQYMMNTHWKLSTLPPAEKAAHLALVAKHYSVDLAALPKADETETPAIKALRERQDKLESSLTQREQTALTEAKTRVVSEVDAFWKDPANVYADEVATDMVPFLNAGLSLKDAYEKAVWANPVTRAKEQGRLQTETEKKLRENARLDALKAKKAKEANVSGRDTRRAPTEPSGKLFSAEHESEMREIVRKQTAH
jgi:hypothetical protein